MEANIVAICENEPSIVAAFLFGSYAKGKEKPSSDIDVALLLSETKNIEFSTLQLAAKLEKTLGNRVDVVILNSAGELLKFQVRRDGKLIFERSSKKRKQFEVKSRKHIGKYMAVG